MNKIGWRRFINLCWAAKDKKILSELLECLLTFEEKESIAMRSMIVMELMKKEISQREIAKKLNVSVAKITRGSNALKLISPTLKRFLEDQASKKD